MSQIHQFLFIVVGGWLGVQPGKAALPTPEALGQLLGFPASELLVEDITGQERILMQTPTRREEKRQTVLPDPAGLLRAYLIQGKNRNSFYPIHVGIGKKNTFLTSDVLKRLTEEEALPPDRRASGTEGFASIGKGGWYFTPYFKVMSDVPPLNIAESVVASITVIQPHGREFDIQLGWRAALSQGEELQLIPGGETYFNTFGPSSEPKSGPQLDRAKIFPELTRIVIAGWLAEQSADGVGPPPPHQTAPTPSNKEGIPPSAGDQRAEHSPPQGPPERSRLWAWLVVIVILCGAVILYQKRQ